MALGIFAAWFDGWIAVLAFLVIIVSLLVVQGRRWLVDLERTTTRRLTKSPAGLQDR
ncbi:MAG: hypothetical protein U5O39_11265 [Gammaproteobacteria bacterium]|nr:hypothetical protein [Gammaproteobacteria bacterium]